MKKINNIILILLIFILSGCGVFKKVFKTNSKYKEDIEVNINKEITTELEDKTITVIKETIDTIIKIKPVKIEGDSKPLEDLSQINNLVVLSNNLIIVRQTYDTLSKKLKTTVDILAKNIPIKFNKSTTISNNINSKIKSKLDSNNRTQIKSKQIIVKKEPVNIFWYVILVLGVIAVGYFISKRLLHR